MGLDYLQSLQALTFYRYLMLPRKLKGGYRYRAFSQLPLKHASLLVLVKGFPFDVDQSIDRELLFISG